MCETLEMEMHIKAVALCFGLPGVAVVCILDLLGVPSSSLSNLTSLGVRPSNSSKQPFGRARFDGEHCNPWACSVVYDGSRKFSAIVVFFVTRNPYTASNNKISLSLYRQYLVLNLDCDGTQQVVHI